MLGINQPKVSAFSKYRLEGFSVERLMRLAVRKRPSSARSNPLPDAGRVPTERDRRYHGSMDTDGSPNTAVVIGDDRGAALKKVSSTLQKAGFVVVTASNGRAALDCCRREHVPVDLAVIDTAAAGIKSPEVEQQLYEMYPHIRMLFLSDDNPETIHETEGLGQIRRVLRKPYRRSRLLGRVLEIMQQPKALGA